VPPGRKFRFRISRCTGIDRREAGADTADFRDMQALPGFRDFYPEEAARRTAIVDSWRAVARSYAFEEYDGPALEPLDLYAKKNAGGEEILGQIYRFEDGGGRRVALRPEMTPTLARMAAAREKHFRKPMKWFSVGNFFRYERQQRGRLREFLQFNCDVLGDGGSGTDAEVLAMAVDTMRAFGLGAEDFVVRLSHRGAWMRFLEERGVSGQAASRVLQIADKLERMPGDPEGLEGTGVTVSDLRAFAAGGTPPELEPLLEAVHARGLGDYIETDLSVVRGLAYYTGFVFEIFDRAKSLRAVAGGGRYDGLVGNLGGGGGLSAAGFAMGDVVLGELIGQVPRASEALEAAARANRAVDLYVVVADEARRPEALGLIQRARDAGLRVDFSPGPQKVARQFQAASHAGAPHALVVGHEWPSVGLKNLATREETRLTQETLAEWLENLQR
jgi:histidyl-tRNA synthetase